MYIQSAADTALALAMLYCLPIGAGSLLVGLCARAAGTRRSHIAALITGWLLIVAPAGYTLGPWRVQGYDLGLGDIVDAARWLIDLDKAWAIAFGCVGLLVAYGMIATPVAIMRILHGAQTSGLRAQYGRY